MTLLPPSLADGADPKVRSRVGALSGAVGIGANVLLTLGKLLAAALSGSVSIMADGLNNLSDATGSIVTLIGFKLSERPADEDHPYGHARFEYLSALAVAAMILIIGFELGKTSIAKVLSPEPVEFGLLPALVLLGSIAVKGFLFVFNRKLGEHIRSNTLLATALDSRNDCVATLAVLIAGLLERFFAIPADGWMGLAVSAFILFSGWNLAVDTISPLLGENGDPVLRQQIADFIGRQELVLGYHDLMLHDYGPGQRFASIHVEMDRNLDPMVCHERIDDMERECLQALNVHLVIHYDPVVTDDPMLEEMRHIVASILQMKDERLSIHDFRMVPGEGHTNLIFDIALPGEYTGQEKQIQKSLEHALNELGRGRFYTVITFDAAAFNS